MVSRIDNDMFPEERSGYNFYYFYKSSNTISVVSTPIKFRTELTMRITNEIGNNG